MPTRHALRHINASAAAAIRAYNFRADIAGYYRTDDGCIVQVRQRRWEFFLRVISPQETGWRLAPKAWINTQLKRWTRLG